MVKTLNKDGTPRKVGSGKTKGAGCYANVTWAQLKKIIGEETKIPVSRVWINNLGFSPKPIQKKIEREKTTEEKTKIPKDLPTPKVTHINNKLNKTTNPTESISNQEYEPPPLFATGENNFNQY